jgi:UDP-N-acetyl-D-glucosamine dehydrogenase
MRMSLSTTEIAVIGVGYVGLPFALALARVGHTVHGIDADPRRIARLQAGEPTVETADPALLRRMLDVSAFHPTTDWSPVSQCDAVVIAVPTPLRSGEPDLTALRAVARELPRHVRAGALVVLESTSYPGTTREVLLPALAEALGTPGEDFNLAFVPERIDPGNDEYAISTTPRVVGGVTRACAERAAALYREIVPAVHIVSTPEAAEMAKLLENAFRNVNIAFANEFGLLCEDLGLDPREVLQAAASKPFGFMPFYPGPGIGGECIPVDPAYLAWRARRLGRPMHLLEHAIDFNAAMPGRSVERITRFLNRHGVTVRGANVLVLGLSYKPDIGDLRNSPALAVLEGLAAEGAAVRYHDPHVPSVTISGGTLHSVALTPDLLRSLDLAVVLVAHHGIDYPSVRASAPLLDLAAGPGLPNA